MLAIMRGVAPADGSEQRTLGMSEQSYSAAPKPNEIMHIRTSDIDMINKLYIHVLRRNERNFIDTVDF